MIFCYVQWTISDQCRIQELLMDFHVAMETFAEVWMTANMQNYSHTGAVTSDPEVNKPTKYHGMF